MRIRCTQMAAGLALTLVLVGPAQADKAPRGWTKVGKVEGLVDDDWYLRKSSNIVSYAREKDLPYVAPVAEGLDRSYTVNRDFMGYAPPELPLEFYFCSMERRASDQPKFAPWLRGASRFAGVALQGSKMCCVNLGDPRFAQPYPPWQVEETCRHEMNHLFAFPYQGNDRSPAWGWWLEAMAETVENTVKPPATRMNMTSLRNYMKGYRAVDADFRQMVHERNNDALEQYRDYEQMLVSIVFYLQDKFGRDVVARIMKAAQVQGLEVAFQSVLGQNAAQLESGWKAYYGIK